MTGRRLQLLIVEDDPQLLVEFEQVAATWGYEVSKATTSRVAIRLLAQEPDLVLLDIDLAGGAARFIAAAQAMDPMPPIVAITGLATLQESFALGHTGVRALLDKPVRAEDLEAALLRALAPPR